MTASLSASDTRGRWPRTYRPAWKLLTICVAVGIAGVIVSLAEAVNYGSDHLGLFSILLLIALLLWGTAVTGRAVKKGSPWAASLVAGLVAVFTTFVVWTLGLLILFAATPQ
jgi:hypothetical protein